MIEKKRWHVEAGLGGKWFWYDAEQASFEGGSLVLYNGDFFGQREVVAAFGPGDWSYVRPEALCGHCGQQAGRHSIDCPNDTEDDD